jgi:hypothetical protein
VLRNEGNYRKFVYDELGRKKSDTTFKPGGRRVDLERTFSYAVEQGKLITTKTITNGITRESTVRKTVSDIADQAMSTVKNGPSQQ